MRPSVPIVLGQSRILTACPRKITRSPEMLNCPKFRTLPRFCPILNVSTQVNTYRPNTYTEFVCRQMRSFELKIHQIHFRPGLPLIPLWSLRRSPRHHSRLGSETPLTYPFPRRRCLDLAL